MLLGILSDTHGRVHAMAEGMRLLRAAGATYFLHCGDVGTEEVLDHLAGEPSGFVFGNTDWDRSTLRRYAGQIGVSCLENYGSLDLGGKKIAITHGDDAARLRLVLAEQEHDYLLVGHTHIAGEQRFDRVRVINPGALHRATVKSVALLNLETDELRWIEVASAGV
ncbi:metallophosphoesterase family protein [Humisphaera borealis]|uniref:Phosphoesterase n=1 Tax=Humisphaera borealis TaxID=2807512 RepID=A0A7M2X104_9BACT|nr:YfcE family phosphodiesterase [Humisphaera borealis]QOV91418.1 YfcE family phosphodiesterase [Humisphaera borealis]